MSDSPALPVDKLCTQNTSHPLIEFASLSLRSIFAQFVAICACLFTQYCANDERGAKETIFMLPRGATGVEGGVE